MCFGARLPGAGMGHMVSSTLLGPGPKLFQILGKQLARVRGTFPACRTYHILTGLMGPAATPKAKGKQRPALRCSGQLGGNR